MTGDFWESVPDAKTNQLSITYELEVCIIDKLKHVIGTAEDTHEARRLLKQRSHAISFCSAQLDFRGELPVELLKCGRCLIPHVGSLSQCCRASPFSFECVSAGKTRSDLARNQLEEIQVLIADRPVRIHAAD
ncbi:hypothetical protein D3C80_1650090 [compost metagenome]